MPLKPLLVSALATLGAASPLYHRAANETFVFTNANGLNFTQMNTTLPNVTIFATGGTIAGSDSSSTATTGYTAGAVGILTLIDAVPSMLDVANVAGVQVSNVASEDVTSDILLSMSKEITRVVCNDPTMAGAVITHGTDTLEESAFFMDATVNCGKPVVIVGAMRPSTVVSADGPFNLLEAVTVAASPKARDRGAMVVMNDRIASAYYPTGKVAIDVANMTAIPRVAILFSYEDMHNDTLYNAIESGAEGIVIAGAGAGGVTTSFNYAIEDAINRLEIPVVQSMRTVNGDVPLSDVSSDTATHIASGYLNPQKSRVLLGLLLAEGKNITEIAEVFALGTDA
ncbi:L-asparaginase [Aspergillus ellipticus CBS 707.79]|uniref:asparaginase n=1 Tax=Aspergillus ellipticus CBS 707.79 TaxID=1448320 RepID=A0A319CWC2_9EURO|nr:L-asparaginase [Aspergillus ellipticus CBS 707.79]